MEAADSLLLVSSINRAANDKGAKSLLPLPLRRERAPYLTTTSALALEPAHPASLLCRARCHARLGAMDLFQAGGGGCAGVCVRACVREWVSEWVREWVSEWVSEWVREGGSEGGREGGRE